MSRWRPRPFHLVALGLAVAILGGLTVFVLLQPTDERSPKENHRFFEVLQQADSGWGMPTPSPELRQFFERCAQVRPEMQEFDIDRLFVDSDGGWSDSPDELTASVGRLKRPTV